MSSLVFFVEEPSMKALLAGLLPRIVPESIPCTVIEHEGKTDLKKSLPRKLRAWGVPDSRFVVLIDQDSSNCKKLKAEIVALCKAAGEERALVRIVCRSLESWILGDLAAAGLALGSPKLAKKQLVKKYRSPDRLTNPVLELRELHTGYKKIAGARAIGPHLHLDADKNTSVSFGHFVNGVRTLVAAAVRPEPSGTED